MNQNQSRRRKARSADPLIAMVDERSEEAVVPADVALSRVAATP